MIKNIPNMLTWFRVIISPAIIFLFPQYPITVFCLLILGSLSDFFDGSVARRYGTASNLGALLDPIADKIFILSGMGILFFNGQLPGWFVFIVYSRDIAQLSSIPLLQYLKISFKVEPKLPAKIATALNFIIICIITASFAVSISLPNDWQQIIEYFLRQIFIPLCGGVEIYILVTFLIRLFQIIKGTQNTFE